MGASNNVFRSRDETLYLRRGEAELRKIRPEREAATVNAKAALMGELSLVVDLNALPGSSYSIAVAPGDTSRIQAWFRDSNPGGSSNFTNVVGASFY